MSLVSGDTFAAPPSFTQVLPDRQLVFPKDFGAHPDYRTEWWYMTGWLTTQDNQSFGFQITFFRSATEHDRDNPSRFAPGQLITAHAALSAPALGKLLHDQKSAREGFGLAYAKTGNMDIKLDNWYLVRHANGQYQTGIQARDFTLTLASMSMQEALLQGDNGFSRKGAKPEQASYYYSVPHVQLTGTLTRHGKPMRVTGTAWLDHEWSSSMLDADSAGWDWVGANLDDGSALTIFQIRGKGKAKRWAYAVLRDRSGRITRFPPEEVRFITQRTWRSPRTQANYPVAVAIQTGATIWHLTPLQDDQELDSRQSTGAVYWEGAVKITRDGQPAGKGYLELTGYLKPLKL